MPHASIAPLEIAGQQTYESSVFPMAYGCDANVGLADALEWVQERRSSLIAEATQHGALFFRGFPIASDQDFDAWLRAFGLENFPYEKSLSNAVRVNRTDRVFTANEAPADVTIYLHHEMAQTPIYPSRLFFFCEQAAATGGATPLCRSDVLYTRLCQAEPEFAENCRRKGLLYSNVMPPENDPQSGMGRSWRSTFRSEDRAEAESTMRELGYTWEWLAGDCLRATTPVLQAVRELEDGRLTFFNQLIAAFEGWKDTRNDPSKAICFGDGEPLPTETVHRAAAIAEELTFDVPWQTGDVALVDNFVAMHGRRSFTGVRKVLASLVA